MLNTDNPNSAGIFQSIVLHAHLPYVRHPEHPKFFEENWLFEAISECYIPLITMLTRLEKENIPGSLTFTLTPTLCTMLQDELLISKYSQHLAQLCLLAEQQAEKNRNNPSFKRITAFYQQHFKELRHLFEDVYQRNLIAQFRRLRQRGRIEIISCAATHALLALTENNAIIRSQVQTGIDSYTATFGEPPRGMWLPECAYTPQVSEVVHQAGIEYSIVDSHGILHGTPMPRYSVFAPVRDRNELILFGRDPESSRQVWSAQTGYPGDFTYREFYRDYGWDGDVSEIGKFLVSEDIRHDLGLKYYRITGDVPLESKEIYEPLAAQNRAEIHGKHFVESRIHQGQRLLPDCDNMVHILSPYDAELFGHWWFEGPIFLESVLRNAANSKLQLITPARYLQQNRPLQQLDASTSSWGNNGYFETWLNGSNDWIYQELRVAEKQMQQVCRNFTDSPPKSKTAKALSQAGRELLLAQSSDWAFILTTDTTTEYATRRVKEHLRNFHKICTMIENDNIDSAYIQSLFITNNIFPNLDYHIFT